MGGSEKSRFFDYFFRTIGDFISKNSVFLRILQVLQNRCPRSNRNFFIFFSKKKCQHSQHVMSKIHEFSEYDFKIFSHFLKKVEKKWFFCTSLTYRKSEEKHKKNDVFLKNYKLTMGGRWKKTQK